MKKLILSLLLLLSAAGSANAQLLKGDMNDDNQVSIADVTYLVNVILGKTPTETISVTTSPFEVDNSLLVGTWYTADGSSFVFNEDGTTNYQGISNGTYAYYPAQGRVLVKDASGNPLYLLPIIEATSEYFLTMNYATGEFTYYYSTMPVYITSISVPLSRYYFYLGEQKVITASIVPEDADNPWVSATCSDNSVVSVQELGNNQFKLTANQTGTAIVTLKAQDDSGVTTTFEVLVREHDYVDLGLPSGTLWATQNIGADEIYEYGLYFAWGETVGHTSDVSDGYIFNFANYKYCEGSSITSLTKYCLVSSYGYNGFVDNLTELELSDDAAYVNWGSNWCMPTQAQMVELLNSEYCTLDWTDVGSEYGLLITSKSNGYQIFLPAAGVRTSSLNYDGENGYYWSKTLESSGKAYKMYTSNGGGLINGSYRDLGCTIRPVRRQ
ncbi:MAG: hypothetical protein K6C10_01365 [Prevotella sp.]|nr:hypothetical protein [Prevotella sp.]